MRRRVSGRLAARAPLLPSRTWLQRELVAGAKPLVNSQPRVSPDALRDLYDDLPLQVVSKRLNECCCTPFVVLILHVKGKHGGRQRAGIAGAETGSPSGMHVRCSGRRRCCTALLVRSCFAK